MRLAALLLCLAACGKDHGVPADAAADAPAMPDAPDASMVSAGCEKFGVTPVTVPAHVTGTLAGADLVAPQGCATIETSFGVESEGPDTVVALRDLVVGTSYVVKLTSASDLQFYVATGC